MAKKVVKSEMDELIELRKEDLKHALDEKERKDIIDDLMRMHELKLKEYDLNKKDHEKILNYIRVGLEAGALILPLATYIVLYFVGLKFEETGSINSAWLRNLMQKIRPTK